MSSSAFVIPHNPARQSNALAGQDVDQAKLWSTAVIGSETPVGTTRIFYDTPSSKTTALSSLGKDFDKKHGDAKRELVRKSVGSAVKAVKALESVKEVAVDASEDPHAAAVASHLALYNFTLKTSPTSPFDARQKGTISPKIALKPVETSAEWKRGVVYGDAQNLARTLMELPGNMMTPTKFCERVKTEFANIANTEIIVRDTEWAEEQQMGSFLSVTRGTDEPAKFLEIHYKGSTPEDVPLALVGKGITFDSGGISLKPGAAMKLMRGDMGGAATVAASALAIAKLALPINFVAVIPLTENMPGPKATKPGDIVYAMNGKSIEVDNTDAEGRLVLADAIYYVSKEFKPHTLIDVATLTGAMDIALGEIFTGVFTNSDSLWSELHAAGEAEYDRFWRMPLDEDYAPQINSSNADLCNTGGRPAGSCTAALFLKPFVHGLPEAGEEGIRWAHVDIAGVMEATRPTPYLEKGMTGRPVRAIVEFVRQSCLPS